MFTHFDDQDGHLLDCVMFKRLALRKPRSHTRLLLLLCYRLETLDIDFDARACA